MDQLQSELDEKRTSMDQLQSELDEKCTSLGQLQSDHSELTASFSELQQENDVLREKLERSSQQVLKVKGCQIDFPGFFSARGGILLDARFH